MILATASTTGAQPFFEGMWAGIRPFVPLLLLMIVIGIVLAAPLPGRGPGWPARRDPWRGFKYESRRSVVARAGGRCEAPVMLVWGRCPKEATEVDHVYPWSRGGATIVSNGQALCAHHNRAKSNRTPAWWYVLGLERRRRSYAPDGCDVRVLARMNAADRAARTRST